MYGLREWPERPRGKRTAGKEQPWGKNNHGLNGLYGLRGWLSDHGERRPRGKSNHGLRGWIEWNIIATERRFIYVYRLVLDAKPVRVDAVAG